MAPETLRDWLKRYRKGGFDALMPKPRADRGRSRGLPPAVVDCPLATKEGNPKLSVRLAIEAARSTDNVPEGLAMPPSTVHRLFVRHGLMQSRRYEPTERDRRRFAFERAGQLWTSDVMHGPSVTIGDRSKRKTYLIAFIDDATRVIPYAAFARSENTQAFLPILKQAILRRGFCERFYVDNGANYRSRHLALVCAKLGIALIYMPARTGPKTRGKSSAGSKLSVPNCSPGLPPQIPATSRRSTVACGRGSREKNVLHNISHLMCSRNLCCPVSITPCNSVISFILKTY